MPDIIKRAQVIRSGDSVRIPDVEVEPPPPPKREEASGETAADDADEQQTHGDSLPDGSPEPAPPEPEPPVVMTREELAECFGEELAEIRREEAERGYFDALSKKKAELNHCIEQVDQELARMEQLQVSFMENFADELKFMALEIAEKLILTRIEEDDMALQKLVMQTVGNVKNADWMDVELSERLVNLVDFMKKEFEKADYRGRAGVSAMACDVDTCRIATGEGTIVATISQQAKNLREAFRSADN